jgi:hypothetical protein
MGQRPLVLAAAVVLSFARAQPRSCCAGGGDGSGETRVRFVAPASRGGPPTPISGVLAQDTARGLVTFAYGGPEPVAGRTSLYGLLVTATGAASSRIAWWNPDRCVVRDFPYSWRENEAPHCAGEGHPLNISRGVAADGGAGLAVFENALGESFSFSQACFPVAGEQIFDGDYLNISTARYSGGVVLGHTVGAPPASRFQAPAACVGA